jgi:hypothetical protein
MLDPPSWAVLLSHEAQSVFDVRGLSLPPDISCIQSWVVTVIQYITVPKIVTKVTLLIKTKFIGITKKSRRWEKERHG